MSYGTGYNGGRTRMGTKVLLNIYDLSTVNEYLYPIGFGLHHSGVEILGSEYSFAGGGGIFESSPKEAAGAKFRESIEVGTFDGGSVELRKIISDLRTDFGPDSYNLIRKNCNHFANALVWALLGKPIPGYVNRLADIGSCMSCLFPKKMLEAAPVGPGSGGSSTGNGGYQVFGGGSRSSSTFPASRETTGGISTFSGSGSKLGSSSNNSEWDNQGLLGSISSFGGTANVGKSDLTDRREKARKAALARFEKQQTDDHGP